MYRLTSDLPMRIYELVCAIHLWHICGTYMWFATDRCGWRRREWLSPCSAAAMRVVMVELTSLHGDQVRFRNSCNIELRYKATNPIGLGSRIAALTLGSWNQRW